MHFAQMQILNIIQ